MAKETCKPERGQGEGDVAGMRVTAVGGVGRGNWDHCGLWSESCLGPEMP